MVRTRGVLEDGLRGLRKPVPRAVLVVDRPLDKDRGHHAARRVLRIIHGHHGHRHRLIVVERALEGGGGGAAARLPLFIELCELFVRIAVAGLIALKNGIDVAADGVARGIRNRLERVEELDVEGGGHLWLLRGTKKYGGGIFNFFRGTVSRVTFLGILKNRAASLHFLVALQSAHLRDLGLLNRLGHGVGLFLGLEPDERGAAVAGRRLDVVDEAVGGHLDLPALKGGEVKGEKLVLAAGAEGENVLLKEVLKPRAVLAEDDECVGDAIIGHHRRGNLGDAARGREGRQVRVVAKEGGDEGSLRGHLGSLAFGGC